MKNFKTLAERYSDGNYYPTNQVELAENAIVEIVEAGYLTDYKIALTFSDRFERTIDFEPFLQESTNPMIRTYLEPKKFASFRVEFGDLIWGDYDLCFAIADLYEGNVG